MALVTIRLFNANPQLKVMNKFCSATEFKLFNQLADHVFKNQFLHESWVKSIFTFADQRKDYIKNPFLDIIEFLAGTLKIYHPTLFARTALAQCFSLAVPSDEAILRISEIAPKVLECGYATSGYWSYMLDQVGCDSKCLSVGKPYLQDKVAWHPIKPVVDVRFGDYFKNSKSKDNDRALLFIWPHDTSVSRNIYWDEKSYVAKNTDFGELEYWDGDKVIVVSQQPSDMIFDPGLKYFPPSREKFKWALEETIEIPQWLGVNDKIRVYRRV